MKRSALSPTLALIAGLALVLRGALALRSIDTLDRWFVPDDTYYTLGFARSLARGSGTTLDGVVQSSGFQPLLAFLLVPVFWLTHAADTALRVTLFVGALADAAVSFLLGCLAHRFAGRIAGLSTALFWAISPLAIVNALGGLETTLALALELGLVLAVIRARASNSLGDGRAARARWAITGILAGLAVLARIDALFLVGAVFAFELPICWRRPKAYRARSAAVGWAALVLLPWWSYCTVRFGSPIPESGAAVLDITRLHRELYLTIPKQLGWAAANAVGAPLFDLPLVREFLLEEPELSELAFALVTGALLLFSYRLLFARPRASAERRALAALVLHAATLLWFYALVLPALWFFRRYLAPCQAVFALLFGVILSWAWSKWLEPRVRPACRVACGVISFVVAALALAGLRQIESFAFATPHSSRDYGLHGAKGYREAALAVLAHVPPGAVLGAFQSGALAYYASQGVRVVNLDGVVDHSARQAAAELRLSDYARSRGVTLLADWPFNVEAFTRLSQRAQTRATTRGVRIEAEPQGVDAFELLELRWPDPAPDQRNEP